jgi:hypothetical protein
MLDAWATCSVKHSPWSHQNINELEVNTNSAFKTHQRIKMVSVSYIFIFHSSVHFYSMLWDMRLLEFECTSFGCSICLLFLIEWKLQLFLQLYGLKFFTHCGLGPSYHTQKVKLVTIFRQPADRYVSALRYFDQVWPMIIRKKNEKRFILLWSILLWNCLA